MKDDLNNQELPTPKNLNLYNSFVGAIGDNNTVNVLPRPRIEALASLPPDISDFVGRKHQQERINKWLQQVDFQERTAPMVIGIFGMAGVGKSRLAIRALHKEKKSFPDGQIYLNLRGADQQPLTANQLLAEVLRNGFGLENHEIASEQRGMESQYTALMSKKKLAVLLDNALDEEQVSPLLKIGGNSAILITSRGRLEIAGELLELKPMEVGIGNNVGESEALMHKIIQQVKPTLVTDDLTTTRKIVELCGRLPLAIRIAAATLKSPMWSEEALTSYYRELEKEETRLGTLENDRIEKAHPGQGRVRASFSLSYRTLLPECQYLFRSMGALPGVDFGLELAATVVNQEQKEIKVRLSNLLEAQVLELHGKRFQFHDLMRLFAREKLETTEKEEITHKAIAWYQEKSTEWGSCLYPLSRGKIAAKMAEGSQRPLKECEYIVTTIGLTGFEKENYNWMPTARCASHAKSWESLDKLTGNLATFFIMRHNWQGLIELCQMSLEAAQACHSEQSESRHLINLGYAYERENRIDEAIACYKKSLEIDKKLGNQHDVAQNLTNIGKAFIRKRCSEKAITYYEKSLAIFQSLTESIDTPSSHATEIQDFQAKEGKAITLRLLGEAHSQKGNHDSAITCHQNSSRIFHEIGEIYQEAVTLSSLGEAYERKNRTSDEALDCYQNSAKSFRMVGDKHYEARILNQLGIAFATRGRVGEAIKCFKRELELKDDIEDVHGQKSALYCLGNAYLQQHQWNESISCYERSLKIKTKKNDPSLESRTLGNLGVAYTEEGQYEKALHCHEQALEVFKELDALEDQAHALLNMANAQAKLGRASARNNYIQAKNIYERIGLTATAQGCRRSIANLDMNRIPQSFAPPLPQSQPISYLSQSQSTSHRRERNYPQSNKPSHLKEKKYSQTNQPSHVDWKAYILFAIIVALTIFMIKGQWLFSGLLFLLLIGYLWKSNKA